MMNQGSRRVFLGGALLGPLLLAGCGGEQTDAAAPPEINFGRDTCDSCGMIISDERYAAALVAADGTTEIFDDIGEMMQAVRAEGLNARRAWVHDWDSREWIDATSATYVQGDPEATPMGTGIVAFTTKDGAEAFAAESNGPMVTWENLTADASES